MENRIIEWIKKCHSNDGVPVGAGFDDAALVRVPDKNILVSSDMLIEGTHFIKGETLKNVGRKAAAVSLSDMAAMGGSPLYLVISLGLPRTTSFSSVKSFFRGVESAVNPFKVKLVGGDTVRSQRVVADTCVIGVVRAGGVLRRMGAKPGDLIFATGAFGYSFSTGWHYLFQPRIKEMEFLKKRMKITSAIDASDGLYASLRTLSRESRVFFRIDASKIRFRKKQRSFRASFEAALFDGEDFELVFTGRCWNFDRLSEQFQKSFQVPLSVIGRVEAGQGMRFIDKEGWNIHVRAREFQHFKK